MLPLPVAEPMRPRPPLYPTAQYSSVGMERLVQQTNTMGRSLGRNPQDNGGLSRVSYNIPKRRDTNLGRRSLKPKPEQLPEDGPLSRHLPSLLAWLNGFDRPRQLDAPAQWSA